MNPRPLRQLPSLCLLILLPLAASAQESTAPSATPSSDEKELHKVNGIFDTDLPKTERKGSVRLIVHPHLGDFTSRSYLRVPVGVRWGVNSHVEFTATVEPYFQHYLRSGSPGNGIGDIQFGGKYAIHDWLGSGHDASIGLNARLPVGHPPLDLTDGYNHYSPFLVLTQKSDGTTGLTYFVSTSVDLMAKSSVAGTFRKDDPHSSSLLFGAGFVLDRYPYHYTLEAGYQTTSLIGRDNKQFFFAKPGFAWDLPQKLTFNSRGRWLFGISMKFTQGPDGMRVDTGGKIRGEFSISRWFRKDKSAPGGAP